MLADSHQGIPTGLRTRVLVEPSRAVVMSVLRTEDRERAEAISMECGIPESLLRRYGARVRQTHRRAGVVVLDVAPERQEPFLRELTAAGFVARPPKPVYPLLDESVPALNVPPVWRSGFLGTATRIAIVDTGADHHADFGDRIAAARDFTGSGGGGGGGPGTPGAGLAAGGRGAAPRPPPEGGPRVPKAVSIGGGPGGPGPPGAPPASPPKRGGVPP